MVLGLIKTPKCIDSSEGRIFNKGKLISLASFDVSKL
jgi:hypothetical protein